MEADGKSKRKEKESEGDLIVQQSRSTTKISCDNLDQVKVQELPHSILRSWQVQQQLPSI
ncbi:hypothetical protein CFP56_004677 [Quercus suber]|uniref:Uncharacterized protein n=1 Tax=Quercus suber TaxID=58331 RepID=A0AAW0LCD7_QUESU